MAENGFSTDPVLGILPAAVGVRGPEHEAPRQDSDKARRRSRGEVRDSEEVGSETAESPVHQIDDTA